ncbi:hypothetical protein QTP88_013129 [Uroleucon formosanum]
MSNTNGVCTRSRANENKKNEERSEGNSSDDIGAVQQKERVQSVMIPTMENSQNDVITDRVSLGEQNRSTNTSQNRSNVESVNSVDTNAMLNTLMVQNNMLMELLKLQQNKPLNDITIAPDLNKSIPAFNVLNTGYQALDWLWTVNGVANLHRWPDNFKLQSVRANLEGAARHWYASRDIENWQDFERQFHKTFVGTVMTGDRWKEMSSRIQVRDENIHEYFHEKVHLYYDGRNEFIKIYNDEYLARIDAVPHRDDNCNFEMKLVLKHEQPISFRPRRLSYSEQSSLLLTRLFELRHEVQMFFEDHPFRLSSKFNDHEWLQKLAYLSDVFLKLNNLNLTLQNSAVTIFQVNDKIESFVKKLEFWKTCIENNQPEIFEALHDFLSETDMNLSQDIKHQIVQHLNELKTAFAKYFPKCGKEDHWIMFPFSEIYFKSAVLSAREKEKLIELKTDSSLQAAFLEKKITDHLLG